MAKVGARLSACMRDSDTVARLGGDEVTVMAAELDQIEDVERVTNKVLAEFSSRIQARTGIGLSFYKHRHCFLPESWGRYGKPDQKREPSNVRRQEQWPKPIYHRQRFVGQ